MKLLIDMNLSPRWVNILREAGIHAEHWSTIGPGYAPDSEIMAYAKNHGCIVLTYDLDFSAILAATHNEKPSVVQIRSDNVDPDIIGTPVITALYQMSEELSNGAVVTIDPKRTRLRLLPFPKNE